MKKIDLTRSVFELTETYPELIGLLKEQGFLGVANPVVRATLGKMTSIPQGCARQGKDLAAVIRKEDGEAISPQYLNDIEHDRRNPPSEFIIEQLANHLKLSKDPLIAAAGMWPTDLRQKLPAADPKTIEQAFTAFRKVLKDKS
jgi:hypothetical protein